jgi:hypothetical protein
MDITPSPEFCAAARIVLGGDTPNIVIPALRTKLGAKIEQIHSEILEGKRVISFPLVPPAGALEPLPHMLQAVQEAAGDFDGEDRPSNDNSNEVEIGPPTEGAVIRCTVCGARPYPELSLPKVIRQDFDLMKLTDKGLPAGEGEVGEWRCSRHFKRLGGDRYQLIGGDADERR